jgi:proteasome lid subunit RPN8/RPN11
MRTIRCALLLLLVCVAGRASADDLFSNEGVAGMFEEVLRNGLYGTRDTESAAFLLRDADGTLRCIAWPETFRFRESNYPAPIPRGVVAIVHTHPFTMPFPSPRDRWTAAQLGVPIYAITRANIYKADTAGRTVAVVRSREWWTRPTSEARLCPYATRGVPIVADYTTRSVPEFDLVEVCGKRLAIATASGYVGCDW